MKKVLPGDIVFWNESETLKSVMDFIKSKTATKTPEPFVEPPYNHIEYKTKIDELKEYLNNNSFSTDILISAIEKYIEKRPASAAEILEILKEKQ